MGSLDVRVEFPQYAPKWEEERDGPNVRLTARCPLCGKAITTRFWLRLDETPIPNETLLQQSSVDREEYWVHLTRAHPEQFQEDE